MDKPDENLNQKSTSSTAAAAPSPKKSSKPRPYEASLQVSSFSATKGLEVFPGSPLPAVEPQKDPIQVDPHPPTWRSIAKSGSCAIKHQSPPPPPHPPTGMPTQSRLEDPTHVDARPAGIPTQSMLDLRITPLRPVSEIVKSIPEGMELRMRSEVEECLRRINEENRFKAHQNTSAPKPSKISQQTEKSSEQGGRSTKKPSETENGSTCALKEHLNEGHNTLEDVASSKTDKIQTLKEKIREPMDCLNNTQESSAEVPARRPRRRSERLKSKEKQ